MTRVYSSASPYLQSGYWETVMDFTVKPKFTLASRCNGWIHETIATAVTGRCSGLATIQSLCLQNWLKCPVSKDKRRVKMFVKKEQVQNEMSLNMHWETREGFLCSIPLFNMHKQHRDLLEITFMFLPVAFE
jgi:hypothetical protein